MQARCPNSRCLGIARLPGYRWIITEQGGSNIIEEPCTYDSEVWGLVFELQADDEANLDIAERVPTQFSKATLKAQMWEQSTGRNNEPVDLKQSPSSVDIMVYISHERIIIGKPRDEYVVRMNKAIQDATKTGLPSSYIENVLRKYVPKIGGE